MQRKPGRTPYLRLLACPALLCAVGAMAAGPAADNPARRAAILDEFVQFLKIPNVASDRANMQRNAQAISAMMRQRGLAPRLLAPSTDPDAPPAIYGEWKVPGAKRTLVLYAHYDGQPVNAAEWTTSPWEPTLRKPTGEIIPPDSQLRLDAQTRIYARGASDDKGGVIVILNALEGLRTLHRHPT